MDWEVMTINPFLTTGDKAFCYGCSACQQVCPRDAITMVEDSEGFAYPAPDDAKCIHCGRCQQACPFSEHGYAFAGLDEPDFYACWNRDSNVLATSSSGGIFALLADETLRRGGIVFGACFDEEFNLTHAGAADAAGCEKFRGSKYVQSNINNTFREAQAALAEGRAVLFSGTPCQIAGLYAFLGTDDRNLLTCDLICSGAPSPYVFQQYRRYLESRFLARITSIRFRDKERGWKRPTFRVEFANGRVFSGRLYQNIYSWLCFQKFSTRPTCIDCKFKATSRGADITLGDYWRVEKVKPDMFNNKGVSVVLLNSEKGRLLFSRIEQSVCSEPCSMKDMQQRHNLFRTPDMKPAKRVHPKVRKQFFTDVRKGFAGLRTRYFLYLLELFLLDIIGSDDNMDSHGRIN